MHRFPRVAPGKASCFWTRPRRRWRWSRTTARRSFLGGVMSAEVRRALFKAEKFASLGGDELAAMMAFIGAATRLVETVEGVPGERRAAARAPAPARRRRGRGVSRPRLRRRSARAWTTRAGSRTAPRPSCVERARRVCGGGEAAPSVTELAAGSVTTHQGRFVLAVTPPGARRSRSWWASPPAEVGCSSSPRAWFY